MASRSFGNVCTNAVGAPHDLSADCILGKRIPSKNDFPNLVGQLFSQLVNTQTFEICPAHDFWVLLPAIPGY